jgi:hypothetical protein
MTGYGRYDKDRESLKSVFVENFPPPYYLRPLFLKRQTVGG